MHKTSEKKTDMDMTMVSIGKLAEVMDKQRELEERNRITSLPQRDDTVDEVRSITIMFTEEIPSGYVSTMVDNIKELSEELGVDILVKLD